MIRRRTKKGYAIIYSRQVINVKFISTVSQMTIVILGLGVFAVGSTEERLSSDAQFADTILVNGKVVTVDENFSIAQAVAIRGERFLVVGGNELVEARIGPNTKIIDLNGKTVLPGLIDTHTHIDRSITDDFAVQLRGATNVRETLELIEDWAQKVEPGEWIIGSGWHPPSQLAEQRYLTRQEIDTVAPDNPVFLPTVGHVVMTNSLALELAGITRSTPDPDGGEIERDAVGEPTGILTESAIEQVTHLLPELPLDVRVNLLRQTMQKFNKVGLTSTVVGGVTPNSFRVFHDLWTSRKATVRSSLMLIPTDQLLASASLEKWENVLSQMGILPGHGDEWLSIAGVKIVLDGGMTLRTAFMREAYPNDDQYFGTSTIGPERLENIVAIYHRNNWRVGVHAVGDAAIDRALVAYENVNKQKSILDRRFILIHASLMQPSQMRRAEALGLRADVQNVFMWDKAKTVERFLGEEIANRAVPTRSMIEIMGLENVGAGTDYGVNPINPFLNIYVMVSRKDINGVAYGTEQAITRKEALYLYTKSAAGYTFEETTKGSIEPGMLADLVIISDDILTVAEESIKDIHVLRTIVGGKTVYEH